MAEKQTTIRLPDEQIKRIDAEITADENRSATIRRLIDRGLEALQTRTEIRALRNEMHELQTTVNTVAATSEQTASQVAATRAEVAAIHTCLPRNRDDKLLQLMPRTKTLAVDSRLVGILPITGQIIPDARTWLRATPRKQKTGHDD